MVGWLQRPDGDPSDARWILVIPPLARDGIAIGIALSYVFREHAQT
jgi:hypothetical protein